MEMMMTRMAKAFIMGKMDADTAVMVFLSSETRPKSRTTRHARMRRTSLPQQGGGRGAGLRSAGGGVQERGRRGAGEGGKWLGMADRDERIRDERMR